MSEEGEYRRLSTFRMSVGRKADIHTASNKIALALTKKWMGHSHIETTEIYTSLIGREECAFARLTWKKAEKLL